MDESQKHCVHEARYKSHPLYDSIYMKEPEFREIQRDRQQRSSCQGLDRVGMGS